MGNIRKRRRDPLAREDVKKAHKRLLIRRGSSPGVAGEDKSLQAMHRRRRWIIQAALALAAVVAVVGTWLQSRHDVIPKPPKLYIPVGAPAPIFGDAASLPVGAREVADARLAGLAGLAEGSGLAQQTQLALAEEMKWPVEIENSIGMRFRLIPHSTFVVGTPDEAVQRAPDETARVAAIRRPVYMGMHEVTQAQWEAVMGAGTNPAELKGANRPVENVTWVECREFIAKLCEIEGVPRWSYRLPYEAEWEYACRAGTQTAWHCGDDDKQLPKYALFYRNVTASGTEPVGQRRPNAWGLHNMHGNVWEWCLEKFYYYEDLEVKDEVRRVIRGGNWHLEAVDCRSASRYRLPPLSHSNLLGFRVVRSIYRPAPPVFHPAEGDRAARERAQQDPLDAPVVPDEELFDVETPEVDVQEPQ